MHTYPTSPKSPACILGNHVSLYADTVPLGPKYEHCLQEHHSVSTYTVNFFIMKECGVSFLSIIFFGFNV